MSTLLVPILSAMFLSFSLGVAIVATDNLKDGMISVLLSAALLSMVWWYVFSLEALASQILNAHLPVQVVQHLEPMGVLLCVLAVSAVFGGIPGYYLQRRWPLLHQREKQPKTNPAHLSLAQSAGD